MSKLSRVIVCGCAIALGAAGYIQLHAAPSAQAGNAQTPATAASATSPDPRALINQYCVTCHNERLKTAGLLLDQMDVAHVGADGDVWEKAVKKIRSGAMPPVTAKRPDKPTLEAFVTGLENE